LLREKGVQFEEIDLNKGLTVDALDHLIGIRDYREFLNSRMSSIGTQHETVPAYPHDVETDVASHPDQAPHPLT
jgi:hypothetical protein